MGIVVNSCASRNKANHVESLVSYPAPEVGTSITMRTEMIIHAVHPTGFQRAPSSVEVYEPVICLPHGRSYFLLA